MTAARVASTFVLFGLARNCGHCVEDELKRLLHMFSSLGSVLAFVVESDSGDDYPITGDTPTPFGANVAFRRHVFDRVGLFDTSRGRKGAVLASGEDGEMFERILAAGMKVVFLGGSRVYHKVESFRTTKLYFRRWRVQTSRNLAMSRGVPGTRRIGNVPLYLLPQTARAALRAVWGRLTLPGDEAFQREIVS